VNKDKIAMFALIIATLLFFQSPMGDSMVAKFFPAKNVPVADSTATGDKPEALLQKPAAPVPSKLTGEDSPIAAATPVSSPVAAPAAKDSTDTTKIDSTVAVAPVVPAKPDTTIIETNRLRLAVAGDGARIISVQLKEFFVAKEMKQGDKIPVELVADPSSGYAGSAINSQSLNKQIFAYSGNKDGRHTFTTMVNGVEVKKSFVVSDSSWIVKYELESTLLNGTNSTILFSSGINESESANNWGLARSPRLLSIKSGKDLEKINKKFDRKSVSGRFDWIAMNSGYFMVAAMPSALQDGTVEALATKITPEEKDKAGNLIYSFAHTSASVNGKANYDIYVGPSQLKDLKELKAGLEKTVFSGWAWFFGANHWFPKISEFTLWLMNIFFAIFKDYGIAIILITIILRLVTYPLTQSSMKSMAKMRDMQPKLQAIQSKYKNNPQMLQAKMIEMYREEGVNPLASLGGCIPMLLQMPIMIAVYNVVSKAVELRAQGTVLVPWITDLSQKEALVHLPFTIPIPFTQGWDTVAILPLIMAVLMFFQSKMSMAKITTDDPNQRMNQLMMLYMMPIMMFFMFYNMPAGLTVYFTFSSILQIIQQFFVDRSSAKKASSVTVVK